MEELQAQEKKNKKGRRTAAVICGVLLFLGLFFLLQRLLTPKYVDGIVEGAFVAE